MKEKEFRRVKTISPMSAVIPFIMVNRTGSQNFISDSVDIEKVEKYIKEKQTQGMQNISMMHVMIAAYIRLVSQRPALNRFIRGQRVWTRKNVEVSLTIKKEMSLDSPDTVVKITLPPSATLEDVYTALNNEIVSYRANPGGDFDDTARAFTRLPGLIFKFAVDSLASSTTSVSCRKLSQRSARSTAPISSPQWARSASPRFTTISTTSAPVPVFFSFGAKRRAYEIDNTGLV